jgi:hypothetical protein
VNAELAQIRADPLATQFLRDCRGGATADEEVGDEVTFVAAGSNDAFN